MIKQIPLLILAFTAFCSKNFGQNQISTPFEISWITENQKKVTPYSFEFFENEAFSQDDAPLFILNQEVLGRPDVCSAELVNEEVKLCKAQLNFRVDNSSFKVKSSIKYGGKQAYAVAEVFPYRVNSLGQIEQLVSATLNWQMSGARSYPIFQRMVFTVWIRRFLMITGLILTLLILTKLTSMETRVINYLLIIANLDTMI